MSEMNEQRAREIVAEWKLFESGDQERALGQAYEDHVFAEGYLARVEQENDLKFENSDMKEQLGKIREENSRLSIEAEKFRSAHAEAIKIVQEQGEELGETKAEVFVLRQEKEVIEGEAEKLRGDVALWKDRAALEAKRHLDHNRVWQKELSEAKAEIDALRSEAEDDKREYEQELKFKIDTVAILHKELADAKAEIERLKKECNEIHSAFEVCQSGTKGIVKKLKASEARVKELVEATKWAAHEAELLELGQVEEATGGDDEPTVYDRAGRVRRYLEKALSSLSGANSGGEKKPCTCKRPKEACSRCMP